MRWNWPFKSRNGTHRNGHHRNGHNGNGNNGNTVTAMLSTAAPVRQVPISFVLERRKPEPPGFIGN